MPIKVTAHERMYFFFGFSVKILELVQGGEALDVEPWRRGGQSQCARRTYEPLGVT